jgi:DNA-binding response OmpR family regulator
LDRKDALNHIRNNTYDLIFIDLMMPNNIRIEIISHACGNTPVLALTAGTASDIRGELSKIGVKDYITMPIDTVRLNILLEEWLPEKKIIYV